MSPDMRLALLLLNANLKKLRASMSQPVLPMSGRSDDDQGVVPSLVIPRTPARMRRDRRRPQFKEV